ncbi:hypothetical protein [Cohnella cellulosilytica]|uniref:Uncharacterized protein n=1 Tax=Cohnella cellulosilytica TaxID=986710 RepID=A0ABW2FC60_9BACL
MLARLIRKIRVDILFYRVKRNITKEKQFLNSLDFDPAPIILTVKQQIDLWDPMRLLAMDCPDDEYDGEVRKISIFIIRNLKRLDYILLSNCIKSVFRNNFKGHFQENEDIINVSKNIISSLQTSEIVQRQL